MNVNPETFAFFKAAGVFRVKSDEKARERFDEALSDFPEPVSHADNLFIALLAKRDADKAAKIAADAERERRKAEKEAALAAMPVSGGVDSSNEHIETLPAGKYVLTVAQNNTDVDADFFASLLEYCNAMGARLLIARCTYNKKGFAQPDINGNGEDALWYAPEVKPFLVDGHLDLQGFHFIADANVIPTARTPISGFDGITPNGVGAIIPASKVALKVGAALKGASTKILASTGACTKRNYILRKAGAVAAIEHNIAAVFVDTVANEIRHLEQMEGTSGFYDLSCHYSPDGVRNCRGHVAAYQPGDIHAEKMEAANLARVLSIIDEYSPQNVVLHDVLDFSSRNHHNIKDPVFMHKQMVQGNTVQGDLQKLASVLDDITSACLEYSGAVHIVESNHDLAINTWLKNADFKLDPINALTYLRCMTALYEFQESGQRGYFNMLDYAYTNIGEGSFRETINFHETDESLVIAGVEMGNHGHNGVNGSRGSPVQFRALGVAMNTGHTHAPSIHGRVYTAGVTASLEMGYNIGASSWAIADVITYDNGQRQILFA